MTYDCLIIGGGIAGLQAAIQLGRYSAHKVAVIDSGHGRSSLCRQYHNLLGWPEGVSGPELRKRGRDQAKAVGIEFIDDEIKKADKHEGEFMLEGRDGTAYRSRTLLLATGLLDRYPHIPGLEDTLGQSVYVCPDCDGYEIQDRKTIMFGSGEAGAEMSLLLSERTQELTYINHEKQPVDHSTLRHLEQAGVSYVEQPVREILCQEEGMITEAILEDGTRLAAERGFIAFGGNHVRSELAEQLGVKLHHNRHVEADPRSKMTNVQNVWVAGDLGVHAEQVTVAMGDGATAAIWIHKVLRKMDRS
ncbi:pyridine nucleotide-disulfide oxidoreductase [Paenibacillus sp. CAA11]|uniref:NAD(P)/FAD-dependent oxidoreductase n=1 Tax=Paenibacillus sp. CAA11 TaxID=1532905 RepID=UPI000D38E513|nr:NAD(P)/FAD-dependent oxidoreductase [Paenibacillus sp. CAA11]AWB44459.1 pyridine nucleotide-disulfide oxidoreductase [Paenibacillus sp. CAA11]